MTESTSFLLATGSFIKLAQTFHFKKHARGGRGFVEVCESCL